MPPDAVHAAAHRSDWPLALLLDEAWLRARRVLVHGLEQDGLWSSGEAHAAALEAQRSIGLALQESVLREALGVEAHALLGTDAIFGRSNARIRRRLPLVLAFGHTLGAGFAAMLGATEERARAAGEACALFNLGISIFDWITDGGPEPSRALERAFDARALERILEGEALPAPPGDAPGEIVVLLRIIAGFFARCAHARRRDEEAWSDLSTLLARAYAAELESTRGAALDAATAARAARDKSALPFAITAGVARLLLDAPASSPARARAREAADALGEAFGILDDLVDLVPDLRQGALNVVLLGADARPGSPEDTEGAGAALAALLTGRGIEDAAVRVRERLSEARRAMGGGLAGGADAPFARALLFYARNWLE
jgi:hypothetical protein